MQSSSRAHNTELFAFSGDNSHFSIADFFIDLMLIFNVFNGRVPLNKILTNSLVNTIKKRVANKDKATRKNT